jgi:hypothetical protein
MREPLELKKRSNTPKTTFLTKQGAPEKEPEPLASWQRARLCEEILEALAEIEHAEEAE